MKPQTMTSLPSDRCSIAPCRDIRQRRNGDHCALALQHRQQILKCNREVVAFHRRRRAGREAYAELPEAAKRRFRQDSVDRAPLRGDFLPHAHAVAVDDDRFDRVGRVRELAEQAKHFWERAVRVGSAEAHGEPKMAQLG
jgi:hypothetical protein